MFIVFRFLFEQDKKNRLRTKIWLLQKIVVNLPHQVHKRIEML
jgi:hypothetical protein